VETAKKRAALAALLKDPALDRVIVFTRTKRGADRVARGLESVGVIAHAIHGNKSQNARQGALQQFRNGRARVLVATDIAARGIDIDAISHVINYEVPNVPESYVHRIGRTARAGATGIAISLCASDERAYMRDIERLMSKKVPDAGEIEGLAEMAASLPAVKHRSDDGEDSNTFDRSRGRVAPRRFLPRALEKDTWHEGKSLRPAEGQEAGRDSGRGAGKPRYNSGDRGGAPRGNAPRGDRPDGARSAGGGDGRRDNDRRGARPPRAEGGDRSPRDAGGERPARRPYEGEKRTFDRPREDRVREDRVREDRPREDRAASAERPSAAKPWQQRDGGAGDRPAPERRERPAGDRNSERSERPARVSRDGERPVGERRNWRARAEPTGDRGGDRGADRGPRRDFGAPRGDRPSGDRPHSTRPSGDRPRSDRPAGDRPAWQNKGPRRDGDAPRGDGPRRDAPRGDAPRGEVSRGEVRGPRRDFGKSAGGGGGDRYRARGDDKSRQAREGFDARRRRPDEERSGAPKSDRSES
ncbi:MAG: helicase-related protein, partial [Hyphomicrobiaceae bacterium]